MDKALKQRLVGASVLVILAVIVLPMLLSGRSDTLNTESRQIELPPKPEELSFETRRFPVGIPDKNSREPATKQVPEESVELEQTIPEPAIPEQTATIQAGESTSSDVVNSDSKPSLAETPDTDSLAVVSSGAEAEGTETVPDTGGVDKSAPVTTVIIQPEARKNVSITDAKTSSSGNLRYLVQVASFSSEKRASAMAAELRSANLPVVMDVVDRTAGRLHRVRVGPYSSRTEADDVIDKVRLVNDDLRPRIVDTRPDESAPVSAPSDPLVRWVVQLGSYANAETADSEVAKLRLAGLAAYSEKVSSAGSVTYKVRVGPEIDRAKAVQLAKDIKRQHHIEGFVTTQQ